MGLKIKCVILEVGCKDFIGDGRMKMSGVWIIHWRKLLCQCLKN